tara:strand:+ start:2054 stop:2227 length:174 start_codon:yes stop_codon:yes gene_type:complete
VVNCRLPIVVSLSLLPLGSGITTVPFIRFQIKVVDKVLGCSRFKVCRRLKINKLLLN